MTPQPEPVRVRGKCIEWGGSQNGHGYGIIQISRNKIIMAHRAIYIGSKGEIPNGLSLDHLCRNRLCINPHHLEAVTNKENVLRGVGISAINSKKQFCVHGHSNWKVVRLKSRIRRTCLDCLKNHWVEYEEKRRKFRIRRVGGFKNFGDFRKSVEGL